MKFDGRMFKRILAFVLILAMVFSSGSFAPGTAALAEGETTAVTEQQSDEVLPDSDTQEPAAEQAQGRLP